MSQSKFVYFKNRYIYQKVQDIVLKTIIVQLFFLFTFLSGSITAQEQKAAKEEFSFIVAADMRQYAGPEYQSRDYVRGAAEAVK